MVVVNVVLGLLILVAAALLWGRRRQFALILVAAALLVMLPALGEPILWLALLVLVVVAFLAPPPDVARAARIFVIVVALLGIVGLVLSMGDVDVPMSFRSPFTIEGVKFQNPFENVKLDLQPPVVREPTPETINPQGGVRT